MNERMNENKKSKIKGKSNAPFNVVLDEFCVCHECGTKIPKQKAIPCIQTLCPQCNSKMKYEEVSF
jgi:hypothetical protein